MTTFEQVKKLVAGLSGERPEDIKMTSNLMADLGFDSLDVLEVEMVVAKTFDIDINSVDLSDIHTVGDIVRWVDKTKKKTLEAQKVAAVPVVELARNKKAKIKPHSLHYAMAYDVSFENQIMTVLNIPELKISAIILNGQTQYKAVNRQPKSHSDIIDAVLAECAGRQKKR